MLKKVIMIDQRDDIVSAFKDVFLDQDDELFNIVEVQKGSISDFDADAIVSPANSFGAMDGGVDLAISELITWDSVKLLQKKIIEEWHGELPVGSATTIKCVDESKFKYLISAPTMRVPENVVHTTHAYNAFRAALLEAKKNPNIETILVPAFCTGYGGMTGVQSARQMNLAFQQVMSPARIPSFSMIFQIHNALKKTN